MTGALGGGGGQFQVLNRGNVVSVDIQPISVVFIVKASRGKSVYIIWISLYHRDFLRDLVHYIWTSLK